MNRFALSALAVAASIAAGSLATGSNAYAYDIPLANGGFETSPPSTNSFGFFPNWTTQTGNTGSGNYSGAFSSYAGYTASEGTRMALIANQGLSFVSLRQATPVALVNNFYYNFSYAYLTTDAIGTPTSSLDTFKVIVEYFSDAAGLNQIASQTAIVALSPLGATSANPGDPFSAAVNSNGTGGVLNNATITLNLPSAPYATFTFYLDNDNSTGKSGVLLDKAFVNPEPGTMALFGLGAMGLGAMAWRRRRKLAVAAK